MFKVQDIVKCIYSNNNSKIVLIDKSDKLCNLIEIDENSFNRELAQHNHRICFSLEDMLKYFPKLYLSNRDKFSCDENKVFIFCYDDELSLMNNEIQLKFDI